MNNKKSTADGALATSQPQSAKATPDGASEDDAARIRAHQRIRLKRWRIANLSYVVQAIIAITAAAFGAVAVPIAALYLTGITIITAGFYAIFRSNFNLRFSEPNLTFAQVVCPIVPAIVLLSAVESLAVRTGLLSSVLVALLYGTLDLNVRKFISACLFYYLSYVGVFLLVCARYPSHLFAPYEWIVLITLALILIQIALIGGFISGLRQTLRQKNVELGNAMDQISELAVRDTLTGAFNRRHLMAALDTEVARARRSKRRFSVCMCDLDHFKHINDSYGHLVGDQVLVKAVEAGQRAIRDIDTFGRYGGEEFLLIMPMVEETDALRAAERLRRQIAALSCSDDSGQPISVTVSIGVATCAIASVDDTRALLRRADTALYNAKSDGRNRVAQAI